MKKKLLILLFFLPGYLSSENISAQSFAINTDGSTASTSAILDVKSTQKGMLIPRMTKAQKNAIASPATGLIIYQASPDSTGFQYYDGSSWTWFSPMNGVDAVVWKTTGNTGTDPAIHFIGTKDVMPIRFKQNNKWIGQVDGNTQNYLLGRGAGENLGAGSYGNTVFGDSSLISATNVTEITAFGFQALKKNLNIHNSAFGAHALENNLNGYDNTASGFASQYNTKNGTYNTSIGSYSLFNDTLGTWNTALGSYALYNGKTHMYNTAVGVSALYNAGTSVGGPFDGGYNTGVGVYAGYSLATGYSNTLIGISSGWSLLSGNGNTALGAYALSTNRRGSGHVAVGYFALPYDTSNNSQYPNVGLGLNVLAGSVSGYGNVGVGGFAGADNISGNFITMLGVSTKNNNFSNSTAVGAMSMVDTSNAMVLGSISGTNGATADVRVGIGTTKPKYSLHVVNTNPNDGGWAQGVLVENTSPYATAGEAAVSFKNASLPVSNQWNVGINQVSPVLAFNYGNSFAAGNTRMVVDTVGNVGIGTISPSNRLHVYKGASGGTYSSSSILILEDNVTSYIQLSNPNAAQNGILSGNAETSLRAALIFNTDSSLGLRTGGSITRFQIENNGNVGVNNTNPLSKLEVNGSFGSAISTITANTTLDETDHTIIISSSVGAGALTVTLPAASAATRREYIIVNQNATNKTISSYRDFSNTSTTVIPANSSIMLQSNGSLWYRIQ